jgi:hypothetical protein
MTLTDAEVAAILARVAKDAQVDMTNITPSLRAVSLANVHYVVGALEALGYRVIRPLKEAT